MPKTASGYFYQFQTVQTASRFGFAHIMEAKFFFAALVLNALSPISGFNQGRLIRLICLVQSLKNYTGFGMYLFI